MNSNRICRWKSRYVLLLAISLSVFKATAVTNSISAGQTTNDFIALGQTNYYSFTASSNDTATVLAATITENTYPRVELQGPNGVVLAAASGNIWPYNAAYLDAIRLTNNGTYLILVWDDGYRQSYDYSVTLVKNPGPNIADVGETNQIASGQVLSGSITGISDMDAYAFDAIVGDTVTSALLRSSGSGQNLVLGLYAPNGSLLMSTTGPVAAKVKYVCLPETGTYLLLCRDDSGNESFNYTISLNKTPGPPPTNAPPDYLQICGCSNQVVVRWSTNAVGFRLQSTLQLVDSPSGTVWSNVSSNTSGGYHYATNVFPPNAKFFRLINP